MARVLAASACGAVVALGLSKLLRGKAEAGWILTFDTDLPVYPAVN